MSDENKNNEQQSELESLGAKPINWFWGMDWACQFLMKTHPATLLVWSAIALVLAGFSTFIGFQAAANVATGQGMSTFYRSSNGMGVFALPAFLFGIVGTLLPMWAVGRLIADAIREGNKS